MQTKDILKELRKSKGYSNMKDFCEAFDISFSTYQNYEAGKRTPTADVLIKLADFYDVTVDYLLGRDIPIPEYLTKTELAFENALIERYKQLPERCRKDFLKGVMMAVEYYKQELQAETEQEQTETSAEPPPIKKLVRHESTIGELEDARAAREQADQQAKKNAG